jgi:hypothetical protein
VCGREEGEVLMLLWVLVLPRLVCESADLGRLLLWFEGDVGELCAERYKLPLDGRGRMEGSAKLAIAFDVLSRANAAKENRALLFCFKELVEGDD